MYLDITQEEKKLTPNERLVFEHLNQKFDMWSSFVDLLERLERDSELDKLFQHMTVYDWTEVQRGLHDKYFKVVKYPKETERKIFISGDFKGYTKNKFLINFLRSFWRWRLICAASLSRKSKSSCAFKLANTPASAST